MEMQELINYIELEEKWKEYEGNKVIDILNNQEYDVKERMRDNEVNYIKKQNRVMNLFLLRVYLFSIAGFFYSALSWFILMDLLS